MILKKKSELPWFPPPAKQHACVAPTPVRGLLLPSNAGECFELPFLFIVHTHTHTHTHLSTTWTNGIP